MFEEYVDDFWETITEELDAEYEDRDSTDEEFRTQAFSEDSDVDPGGIGVPRVYRYSIVTLLWTAVEIGLRVIVFHEDKRHKSSSPTQQIKVSAIDRLKTFLSRECDVDFATVAGWDKLATVQKVRDCIVHCGGYVEQSKHKEFLKSLAASRGSGISMDAEPGDTEVLEVDREFIRTSLSDASEFFGHLVAQLHASSLR